MATYDLATKFSPKVDEAFSREALLNYVTNQDYDWDGVETVKVYSIPVVDIHNYTRSGSNRYGTPDELGNSTQTLTLRRDRSWTFSIDRGNKIQSMMVNICPIAA